MSTTDKSPGVQSLRVDALIPEMMHYAQINPDVILEDQKKELIRAAKYLIANLQDPNETAWFMASGAKVEACLLTASRMGLFRAWDDAPSNTMTAEALGEKLDAHPALIVRILRMLVVHGVFEEVQEEVYVHNRLSRFISTWPFDQLMHGFLELTSDIHPKMPTYLETVAKYQNPGELKDTVNLFQFARRTKLSYFEWLEEHPEYRAHFDKAMDDVNAWFCSGEPMRLAALYPFEEELGYGTVDDDVVLVDVGGCRGQLLVDVHKHLPNLTGRLVLEDLPKTVTGFTAPLGIEVVPYNFFEPQPIVGARAYVFRHIMHDWPDYECKKILANTIPAMVKGRSRILIIDQVLPNLSGDVSAYEAFLDIGMMFLSAGERKETQWRKMLREAGLRIVKIWPETKYDKVIEALPIAW